MSISLIFALTRPPRALLPRGSRSTSPRTLPLKERAAHARPVEHRRAKIRLPWPRYDPWTAHASARLIWGCWCNLRRGFSKVSQVANLPRYSTFLEFFGKGTQGGPCECSRPLAERSLRYPSYTNFRDRREGAGLLIQTNRSLAFYAALTALSRFAHICAALTRREL